MLLTDEEIRLARLSVGDDYGDEEIMGRAVAKAQLKKVVEWLQEHSWDGSLQHWGAPTADGSSGDVQCLVAEDWQSLLEEG